LIPSLDGFFVVRSGSSARCRRLSRPHDRALQALDAEPLVCAFGEAEVMPPRWRAGSGRTRPPDRTTRSADPASCVAVIRRPVARTIVVAGSDSARRDGAAAGITGPAVRQVPVRPEPAAPQRGINSASPTRHQVFRVESLKARSCRTTRRRTPCRRSESDDKKPSNDGITPGGGSNVYLRSH